MYKNKYISNQFTCRILLQCREKTIAGLWRGQGGREKVARSGVLLETKAILAFVEKDLQWHVVLRKSAQKKERLIECAHDRAVGTRSLRPKRTRRSVAD